MEPIAVVGLWSTGSKEHARGPAVLTGRYGICMRVGRSDYVMAQPRQDQSPCTPVEEPKVMLRAPSTDGPHGLDEAFQAVEGVPPSMWRQRVADRRESNAAAHGPTQTGHAGAG